MASRCWMGIMKAFGAKERTGKKCGFPTRNKKDWSCRRPRARHCIEHIISYCSHYRSSFMPHIAISSLSSLLFIAKRSYIWL